jgi:hypothetical protein
MLRPLGYVFFSIDEVGRSIRPAADLWDNDHQNFLVCRTDVAETLRNKGLITAAGAR